MTIAFWLVIAAIIGFGVMGYRVGIIRRLLEMAGLVGSILLASRLASGLTPTLVEQTGLEETPALVVTWVILVVTGLLLTRMLAWSLSKVLRVSVLGWVDRWGGAACGLLIGTLVASVILVAISQVPGGETIQVGFEKRPVGKFVFRAAPQLYLGLRELTGGGSDEVWDRFLESARERAEAARETVTDATGSLGDGGRD